MGRNLKFAFLCDNDGVLIDSSEMHWQSWLQLMREDPSFFMDKEQFLHSFGKRNDLILKELHPHVPSEKRHAWEKRKEEIFRKIAHGKITLLPGMESFLKLLKEKGIPRIIASSTPLENLKMFVESTVLGNYFDEFVSAEQVDFGKPSPDIFLLAAKRIGFPPSACIVLEDAPAGLKAGKDAGCFVVALATTHPKEKLKNYHLIYSSPVALDLQEITDKYWAWRKTEKKLICVRIFVGSILVLLGAVGLFIPFAPGFLLIFVGLYLINRAWAQKQRHRFSHFLMKWKEKMFNKNSNQKKAL